MTLIYRVMQAAAGLKLDNIHIDDLTLRNTTTYITIFNAQLIGRAYS
jgi:hypothetical protein